jgi:hypothetical protein
MLLVRRVASGVVVAVCVGAMAMAFAVARAHAQPVTRAPAGLRPAIEDPDEPVVRTPAQRAAPRRDTRPLGTRFDPADAMRTETYGNPPASGAGRTGYNSTNARRRTPRTTGRKAAASDALLPAPLSLMPGAKAAPSFSATGQPLGISPPGTTTADASAKAAKPGAAAPAAQPASPPRRNTWVRIPDGTTTGGIAGTVNTATLPAGAATLLRRRVAPDEDAFAPTGIHAGAFIVQPALETTGGYDTNPARVPGGKASSFVTVAPELNAKSDWERHEVTVALRGSYTAYDQTPELDRPSFDGKVTGRLDVTRNTALIGEGTLVVGTDNPGSPNVQAGLARFPIYTTLGGTFGLTQRFNRVEVTAKGTVERTEYQDSTFTDGTTASNKDRDFNRFGATLRAAYDVMPGVKPFVEVAGDTREHDLAVDAFGFQRDSTGWSAKAGTSFYFSRLLTGEFALGYVERDYKDPSLKPLSGFTFDASLVYAMTALTNVKVTGATVAAETTVPGTSGVLTRNAGVEIEHAFRRWLIGGIKLNYGYDDYVGSDRKDNRYSVGGTLTYKLNREMAVKAEIREEWLHSSVANVDYTATVFMLGMRLQR